MSSRSRQVFADHFALAFKSGRLSSFDRYYLTQLGFLRQISGKPQEDGLTMPADGKFGMTRSEFLRVLERELGLPKGSMKENQELAGLGAWDSMASLLFIALVDEKLGVVVPDDKIGGVKTVNELLALLGDRLTV